MRIKIIYCKYRKVNLFIVILILSSSLLMTGYKDVNSDKSLYRQEKLKPSNAQALQEYTNSYETTRKNIQTTSPNQSQVPYNCEQRSELNFTSRELLSINNTNKCPTYLKSEILYSSYNIESSISTEETIWVNNIEPDYGEVNITKIISPDTPFYRLNFSENNVTPASGASNINFINISNPPPFNYSTFVSFEFQIPILNESLLNEGHSLVMELRFNNASINFVLSDNGSVFGEPLEEGVYKPGSNSLYIVSNNSYPCNWVVISKNITRLITTYFPPSAQSWFTQIETLFCYLFAFVQDYNVILDIKWFNLTTSLSLDCPIIYDLGNYSIFSENGSFQHEYNISDILIQAIENTSWVNNQITIFKLSIVRDVNLFTQPNVIDWNATSLQLQFLLVCPELFSIPHSRFILINLPSDWYSIEPINSSATIEKLNQVELLSGDITGFTYLFSIQEDINLTVQCQTINYFLNIDAPTSITRYNRLDVFGILMKPLPGTIHLYILNQTVYSMQTTLSMLNGSFIFPSISITDTIPLGFVELKINWSCGYEQGIYHNLLYIHQTTIDESSIVLTTPEDYELYQYDTFSVNLSLYRNDQIYESDSTLVYCIIGLEMYKLNRSLSGFYYISVDHILWQPRVYNVSIIASDSQNFFAERNLNLTVYPAVLDWYIDDIPIILDRDIDLSFEIDVFICASGGGTQWPAVGIGLTILLNESTIIKTTTDLFGHVSIIIPFDSFTNFDVIELILILTIKDALMKVYHTSIEISDIHLNNDRFHPTINEYSRTSISSNGSFYRFYYVNYSTNASQWYILLDEINGIPISAFLIRDDYALDVTISGDMLVWDYQSNSSDTDTLVLEFLGPMVYYSIIQENNSFFIHLESYSNFTITNYTLKLNLDFIKFPIGAISILDILGRNITNRFDIIVLNSIIFLKNLSINPGIKANYFLEVIIILPSIYIEEEFKAKYAYDEIVFGSWKFNSPNNFSYSVIYTIVDYSHSVNENTSLSKLSNGTFLVKTWLPLLRWNSTVTIQLFLFYPNEVQASSIIQRVEIIDPYPPYCSYFVDFQSRDYELHLVVYESDLGSGLNTVQVFTPKDNYSVNFLALNHYFVRIPKNTNHIENITVIVKDWAGNENLIILDRNLFSSPTSSGQIIDPSIVLSSIFSMLLISGVSISKYVKKRKSSIL